MKISKSIKRAKEVLRIEAESILHLIDKLDANFEKAVRSEERRVGKEC
jgi:hypothetical protein